MEVVYERILYANKDIVLNLVVTECCNINIVEGIIYFGFICSIINKFEGVNEPLYLLE